MEGESGWLRSEIKTGFNWERIEIRAGRLVKSESRLGISSKFS